MKTIIKAIIIAGLSYSTINTAIAQDVRETTISYNKGNFSGVIADYNYSKDLVTKALDKRLKDANLGKSKTSSKFTTYAGVTWMDISPDKLDVYYKVSGKKNKSTVEFLISKGYDNYINSTTDASAIQNLRNFLASLDKDIRAIQHENNLSAQNDAIKKAEKELKSAQSSVSNLEKDLDNARKNVEKKQKALDDAQKKLDQMK